MTTTPTPTMPNFKEPFVIETYASGEGIGTILSQQGKPLAFMSKSLGPSKRTWSTYAKEMVHAIQTWKPYLIGHKFYIQTYQKTLKNLIE